VIDEQERLLQIDRVICQQEAHPFMIDERLAKGAALDRVSCGFVVRALRRTPPAHAMGQSRRGETHLCIPKTLMRRSKDGFRPRTQTLDADAGMPAR